MTWRDALKGQLQRHEGYRRVPYRCSAGKLTIGFGRNLEDRGIAPAEALYLLDADVDVTVSELDRAMPWWARLSHVRRLVLADMHYNLGLEKLRGFRRMLAALQSGNYEKASDEMLDSKWARHDVPRRAARLAQMMRTNEIA